MAGNSPAEFRTLRERLGLSGEVLGSVLERPVTDRTIRRWEAGALDIPEDAWRTLRALDAHYERAALAALAQVRAIMAEQGGPPEGVDLLRYADASALARRHPEFSALGVAAHAAMVGRIREALVREGVEVRVLWAGEQG